MEPKSKDRHLNRRNLSWLQEQSVDIKISLLQNHLSICQIMINELLEEKPDLLILDVMFPENPAVGFDLAREIRQTDRIKDLPIILLTAINQEFPMDFSSKDIDQEWMPVEDFAEKPVDIKEMLDKVKKILST